MAISWYHFRHGTAFPTLFGEIPTGLTALGMTCCFVSGGLALETIAEVRQLFQLLKQLPAKKNECKMQNAECRIAVCPYGHDFSNMSAKRTPFEFCI